MQFNNIQQLLLSDVWSVLLATHIFSFPIFSAYPCLSRCSQSVFHVAILAVRSVCGEESEPSLSRRLVELVQEVLSAAQDPQLENLCFFIGRP